MYLMELSFRCGVYLFFLLLCLMYILCQVCDVHVLSMVFSFYCSDVFFRISSKFLPVCPTYFSGKLLHLSWNMPLSLQVSAMCFFVFGDFLSCLCFRKVFIRTFVFLNSLVMILVSFPLYVEVIPFMCVWSVLFYVVVFVLSLVFIHRIIILM
jgi:hypothetical protein